MEDNKKNFWKGALAGALAMFMVGAAALGIMNVAGVDLGTSQEKVVNAQEEKKLNKLKKLIDENYLYTDDLKEEDLENGLYSGYINALGDPYSVYYDEEQTKSLQESTSGEYSGIGVVFSQNQETKVITAVQVYENSPANEAGIQANDILYKVGDKDVSGTDLSDVVQLIRGVENTTVDITVLRGDDAKEVTMTVTRRKIQVETVKSEMKDDQIGYIRVTEFDSVTYDQFKSALDSLEEQGMKGLVVDLRANPGGNLATVTQMLDLLLPKGTIVSTKDKSDHEEVISSDDEHQFTKPMAVVVDGNSASASEIFAGAIQDYGLGLIVGTTTYGKGIVQQIFDLGDGCEEMGNKVNDYLVKWRKEETRFQKDNLVFNGYEKPNYLINAKVPRFGSGEAKGIINESVRGKDLYLMVDVCNYSLTYSLSGNTNHMSPDDHFQNLKRVIAAVGGQARRLNVIMPFLYESRQHKRSGRESLDCALGLQELVRMGVDNIITFDAHDPRVQNAIPLNGFETIRPTYQFVKGLLKHVPDLQIDADHMMAISPDEGATGRAIYFANVLGLDMGMFYKRRDYTTIVDGRNPIVAHEFLGSSVEGKDVIILDDMISSGDSILDVARQLKMRKAKRIYAAATFGLFTNGMEKFDQAYEEGLISGILTTNLIYQTPELLSRPYYINCDMSKYIALVIDTLNHDASISSILDPSERIQNVVEKYKKGEAID